MRIRDIVGLASGLALAATSALAQSPAQSAHTPAAGTGGAATSGASAATPSPAKSTTAASHKRLHKRRGDDNTGTVKPSAAMTTPP